MKALRRLLLQRLGRLDERATMCPGRLARDCGTKLADARDDILALAREGKIALFQRGRPAKPEALKGPFRVRLR